jgi:2-oxo-3-hexenedioate decarboxylase
MSRAGAIAGELLAADASGSLLPLITAREAGFGLAEAFDVLDQIRARRIAGGARPVGWKIGFTNRTLWDRYGVHAPIWAPVWDTTTTLLDGTRAELSLAGLCQPRIEPEVVFGFARAPRAGMDAAELTGCLAWVAHGFEFVHTHFDGWKFTAADCLADFALHGRLLVGPRVPVVRFGELGAELAALRAELYREDLCVDTGVASCVLDGPLNALRLWIDAMARHTPQWLVRAGDLVTTGTITDAWPVAAGQCWRSTLSDARLAGLEVETTE